MVWKVFQIRDSSENLLCVFRTKQGASECPGTQCCPLWTEAAQVPRDLWLSLASSSKNFQGHLCRVRFWQLRRGQRGRLTERGQEAGGHTYHCSALRVKQPRPIFKPRPSAGAWWQQQQTGPALWASRSLSSAETSPGHILYLDAVCNKHIYVE